MGYLLYMENWNDHKEKAKVGEALFNNTFKQKKGTVSIQEALLIKESFGIGYHRWTDLRRILLDEVYLPPSYLLATEAKKMLPDMLVYKRGIRATVKSSLQVTLQEILDSQNGIEIGGSITFTVKFGLDGSGKHCDYNQRSKGDSTSSVMMACFSIDEIENEGNEIWNTAANLGHNSPKCTRVLALFPEKESFDLMKEFYPLLESEMKNILDNGIELTVNGQRVIEAHMKNPPIPYMDGKMLTTLLGLSGGYCTMCKLSMIECHDVGNIENGFIIDRSLEEIIRMSDELADDAGVIKSKRGDYGTRTGITHKPISQEFDLTRIIPVLHAKIQGIRWLMELLEKILGSKHWSHPLRPHRYTKEEKDKEKIAKHKVQEIVKSEIGVDISNPSINFTGNMFKRMSSDESRRLFCRLIDDDEESKSFEQVHLKLCTVIRLINSQRRRIDFEAFKDLCRDTCLHIVQSFPWAVMSTSVHRVLAHGPELVQENDLLGLGGQSEEGLETNNKFVRALRRESSRKTSTEENFQDTFQHLWLKSSPLLIAVGKEKSKLKKERKRGHLVLNEIDSLTESLFQDDE